MDGDRWARNWLPAAGVSIGVALTAGPLLAILLRSLLVWTAGAPHLSPDHYGDLFGDRHFGEAIANTLIAAACTTILSLALGFCLAFLVARTDMPGRRWLGTLNYLPLFLSPYAGAMAWLYLLAPHGGLITTWAYDHYGVTVDRLNIYSLTGVIFVLTMVYTPYVYLFLIQPLRETDTSFEDTARVHGATFWTTIREITLPMLLPELSAAALIVFVTSAGTFDVPFALGFSRGIPFVPTEIYAMVRDTPDSGRAAAIGVVLLTLTGVLALARRRLLTDRRFGIEADPNARSRLIRLSWPARMAALSLEATYIAGGALVPFIALLIVSLSKQWAGKVALSTMTAANFVNVLTSSALTRGAIANTVILAIAVATIGVALGVPLGYRLDREARRHRGVIANLLSSPFGVPGIIFGLGFLLLAAHTPLYGTSFLILAAFIARFLPFATRNLTATFAAIDPDLEQIARISGANRKHIARYIIVPLLKPSLLASWLMLFVLFVRELGTIVLLYAPGTETISTAMVDLTERDPSYVAALAMVQMFLLLLAFILFVLTRASFPRRAA